MTDRELLEKICDQVENDFAFTMECKLLPNSADYTQTEGARMAMILGRVYHFSHQIHCVVCASRPALSFSQCEKDIK